MTVQWYLGIDWDDDDIIDLNTDNEAVYMTALNVSRGRQSLVERGSNTITQMRGGTCSITLDNSTGRFDPYNTSSAIYPNVSPGKFLTIAVAPCSGEDFSMRCVFSGYITEISSAGGVNNPKIIIEADDGLDDLGNNEVSSSLYEDITTNEAVEYALKSVGYGKLRKATTGSTPGVMVVLDGGYPYDYFLPIGGGMYFINRVLIYPGADNIPYWSINNESPLSAIQDITAYEFGNYAINDKGSFMWQGRMNSTVPVVTIDQSDMLKDVLLPLPHSVIKNTVRVHVYPKTLYATAALWTLGDKPFIGASESLEVWGDYKYDGRAVMGKNMAQPVATTDYTMNTAEDGSGTDKTADFTVTATYFGGNVKNVIENNGTAAGAYVTLLQNRGQGIETVNKTYVFSDTAGTDMTSLLVIDTPWMQDTSKAQQYADYLLDIFGESQKYPVFQIETNPEKQFAFDLLDPITLTIAKYSINQNFRVIGIDHEWLTENGQSVLTTVYVEPYIVSTAQDGYWFFPMTFSTIFPY